MHPVWIRQEDRPKEKGRILIDQAQTASSGHTAAYQTADRANLQKIESSRTMLYPNVSGSCPQIISCATVCVITIQNEELHLQILMCLFLSKLIFNNP